MKLVCPDSLAATLDAVNDSLFSGRKISVTQREQTARWIGSRQGQPRGYAGMPSPTEHDFSAGVAVFTGEKVRSGAATGHILGEEACRALIRLNAQAPDARMALVKATDGMLKRLAASEQRDYPTGTYCCGICSCSYWRHLAAGGLNRNEERLAAGMKILKASRLENGRWRRFPFFYTLLALTEIEPELTRGEIHFAAPICERILKINGADTVYASRRRRLAEMALAAASR